MASTINSTIKGKAYEYACVLSVIDVVSQYRNVFVENNESLEIAKDRYKLLSKKEQNEMILSATAGIKSIINMEPKIVEDGKDKLVVSIQADNVAKDLGDIRDVLIIRRSIMWEIGISVKHNHSALKHSRISNHLDFGQIWVNSPCSKTYFKEIEPVFQKLSVLKENNRKWSSLSKKEDDVYVPLLNAFKTEFIKLNKKSNITGELVKYLIGSNGKDYYKLIHSKKHFTRVIPFNIMGTLNKSSLTQKPKTKIPKILLPTKILDFNFKEKSKTTLILTMDNAWSISFRIHNASTIVEPSLKFDIQIFGSPDSLFYIDTEW